MNKILGLRNKWKEIITVNIKKILLHYKSNDSITVDSFKSIILTIWSTDPVARYFSLCENATLFTVPIKYEMKFIKYIYNSIW